MSSYPFPDVVCGKAGACDAYIRANINNPNNSDLNWVSHFQGISTAPLTVYTDIPLTESQLAALTVLINAYVDPAVFLVFDHVDTFPLHSHFTNDRDNTIYNGNVILQTFIFSANNNSDNIILDSLKTVIEYDCTNVQDFLNITSGNTLQTGLSINDITRNVTIASQDINIDDVVSVWHDLAVAGSTSGNIQYKSIQYTGLMNKNAGYDCIWQLSTPSPIETSFTFRCHSFQYIYYNVE